MGYKFSYHSLLLLIMPLPLLSMSHDMPGYSFTLQPFTIQHQSVHTRSSDLSSLRSSSYLEMIPSDITPERLAELSSRAAYITRLIVLAPAISRYQYILLRQYFRQVPIYIKRVITSNNRSTTQTAPLIEASPELDREHINQTDLAELNVVFPYAPEVHIAADAITLLEYRLLRHYFPAAQIFLLSQGQKTPLSIHAIILESFDNSISHAETQAA